MDERESLKLLSDSIIDFMIETDYFTGTPRCHFCQSQMLEFHKPECIYLEAVKVQTYLIEEKLRDEQLFQDEPIERIANCPE